MKRSLFVLLGVLIVGGVGYWLTVGNGMDVLRVLFEEDPAKVARARLRGPRLTLRTDHLPLYRVTIGKEAWIGQFLISSTKQQASGKLVVERQRPRGNDRTSYALMSEQGSRGTVISGFFTATDYPMQLEIEDSDDTRGSQTLFAPGSHADQLVLLEDAGIRITWARNEDDITISAIPDPGFASPRPVAELLACSETGRPAGGAVVATGGRRVTLSQEQHGLGSFDLEDLVVSLDVTGLRNTDEPLVIRVQLDKP